MHVRLRSSWRPPSLSCSSGAAAVHWLLCSDYRAPATMQRLLCSGRVSAAECVTALPTTATHQQWMEGDAVHLTLQASHYHWCPSPPPLPSPSVRLLPPCPCWCWCRRPVCRVPSTSSTSAFWFATRLFALPPASLRWSGERSVAEVVVLGSSVLLSVLSVQGALLCALFCDGCCGPSPLWVQCCVLCHACSALGAVLLFYSFVSMRDGSLCAGCVAVSRQCVEHLSLPLSCRLPPPPSTYSQRRAGLSSSFLLLLFSPRAPSGHDTPRMRSGYSASERTEGSLF